MATTYDKVLTETFGPSEGTGKLIKQAVLVVAGIAALIIAAKTNVSMLPSPVPITLGTFGVLTIAVAYGPRLGLITIAAYTLLGAAGFNVFANTTGFFNGPLAGINYMLGGSGGYILGYVFATVYLGTMARQGMDRRVESLFGSLLVANALIYVPGLLWLAYWITAGDRLAADTTLAAQTFAWGLTPYVIGDLLKLAVAGMLIPALWKLIGNARS